MKGVYGWEVTYLREMARWQGFEYYSKYFPQEILDCANREKRRL
jgi:hypothetical protein